MRMIDKAGGELGKAITHPLQREFERSLTRVLGSQENWKVGDRITMGEFRNVQNKEFVRTRLESLGFMLGRDVSTYVYIAQVDDDRRQNEVLEVDVTTLNPAIEYRAADLREIFKRHDAFTTMGLDAANKQRISCAISWLRRRGGYEIKSVKKREGISTSYVTYYLR